MKKLITVLAVLGMIFALAPAAQAAEWTGGASGEWTVDGNWDGSYPNAIGAVANFGTSAAVNVSSPITVGQITDTGAHDDTFLNSLSATGTGSITFDNGGSGALFKVAKRDHRTPANTTYSVPMVLDDDLEIRYQTQRTRFFTGPISGSGELTWARGGNSPIKISGSSPNTYLGGTIIAYIGGPGSLWLDKDGAVGTGNMTMTANSVLNITDGGATDDRIDDSASLYMEKEAIDGYSVLTLDTNVDETVGGLYFNNVLQATGTWGATGSGAENIDDNFFTGTGVLRVVIAPPTGTVLIIQ